MPKKSWNITFASLVISMLFLVYVCFILVSNYRSQTAQQRTILKQFSLENERLAVTVGNFLNNRSEDLINLAASRPLNVFFENKALGMSAEYGLKQSIPPIKQMFHALLNRQKTEAGLLYSRILFLDERGNILADVHPPDARPPLVLDAKTFLAPAQNKPTFILKDQGKEIILSLSYYFKGAYSGQIVAWLQPEYLTNGSLVGLSSRSRAFFLVAGSTTLPLSAGQYDLPDASGMRTGQAQAFVMTARNGKRQDMIGIKTAVQDTTFSVVTAVPVDELFEGLEPKGLLLGMGILAILILGGAVFSYRTNIQALVLSARLDEEQHHRAEMLETNKQLEEGIAERIRAEATLREVNNRLNAILQASPAAIYLLNPDGKVTLWNKAAEEMFGWSKEEAIGSELPIVQDDKREDFFAYCNKLLQGGVMSNVELERQKRDGSPIDISVSAAPLYDTSGAASGIMAVAIDITFHKKLEDELLKKEKLESIGILAGGIAHDFNNLLTAIVGNIGLAKMFTDRNEKAYQMLVDAENASLRARDLTQQLLTFSRGGAPVKKLVSLERLIRESVSLVLRGSKARGEIVIARDLWNVEADEGQIGQVIHNVILNADQAMSNGGIITIQCENVVIASGSESVVKEGSYVRIAIQDHGIGIPKEHLEKIFDPYFTTKQRGSGLGLASSYSIVKKHAGRIMVESALGVGTTFHIYLPASYRVISSAHGTEEKTRTGSGKILIMDDEEMVRAVAGEILKALGYDVAVASDGSEALEKYQQAQASHAPFDVVIMDLTIPGGMGGEEAIKKLLEMDPHAKAIVSSGYAQDPIMSNFRDYGFKALISKPYRPEELSTTVRTILFPS